VLSSDNPPELLSRTLETADRDLSIASATDVQYNQDDTLPTAVPRAAPKPSPWAGLSIDALAVGLLAVRRRRGAVSTS
jgi:hypothetical protein